MSNQHLLRITTYLVLVTYTVAQSGNCPSGWYSNAQFCYYLGLDEVTFNASVEACKSRNSNLVSIHSVDEQMFIMGIYRKMAHDLNIWIGLHDRAEESTFEWVDGTPLDYVSWSRNQPDNYRGVEDCGHLWPREGGNWNDMRCYNEAGFICKVQKVQIKNLTVCSFNVTQENDDVLTWQETASGEVAFSDETCPPGTQNTGLPIAIRRCEVSASFEAQWGSVQPIGCSKEETPSESQDTGYCPPGWYANDQLCYFVSNEAMTFNAAVEACKSRNSSLVSIHSLEEQLFLMWIHRKIANGAALWIGLHDKEEEDTFEWVDGTTLDYLSWSYNQPDDHRNVEDCGSLWAREGGNWNDAPCHVKLRFICKTVQTANPNVCSFNVTHVDDNVLTWPETDVGEVAFSDETCPPGTENAGLPIAIRRCEVLASLEAQWGSVQSIGCSKEATPQFTGDCQTHRTPSYGSRRVQNQDFEFVWPKLTIGSTSFNVLVRGGTDVYILLSPTKIGISNDNYGDIGLLKILIGGWSNQQSGILCISMADWRRWKTPNILSSTEFREFRVAFANNVVEVGLAGKDPFIRHTVECLDEVNYVGITSGYNVAADWKYCASTCHPPWELFGSFCYYIEKVRRVTFHQALSACEDMGGNLTSIHTQQENHYLTRLVSNLGRRAWIGMHDISDEGHFEWIDGTPMNYMIWNQGQPDNWDVVGVEDCGQLYTGGTWNDAVCSQELGFICKQPQDIGHGYCAPDETYFDDGVLSWPKAEAGKSAFSIETCGASTDNRGLALATRYCQPTSVWGNVQMLRCNDETPTVAAPVTVAYDSCESNWKRFGNFCYFVESRNVMNFADATIFCQIFRANLTSIHSADEDSFHSQLTQEAGRELWIGFHDTNNEDQFEWIDGTSTDYTNWFPGEPDDWQPNGGEDCSQMRVNGFWGDLPCSRTRGFICKQPKSYFCEGDITVSEYGVLSWPRTYAGEAAFSLEICPKNTQHRGSPIAFRVCQQPNLLASADPQGIWGPVKLIGCQDQLVNTTALVNITVAEEQLPTAPQLAESDIEAVSRKLDHFTQTMEVANSTEVHAISWMVSNIASIESTSLKVLGSVCQAVNALLDKADPSLRSIQSTDLATSTSDITRAIEQQVRMTLINQNEFNLVQPSLLVAGVNIANNGDPVRFDVYKSKDRQQFTNKVPGDSPWDTMPVASIQIPPEAIDSDNASVGFIVYKDNFLFRSKRSLSQGLIVTGPVIATTMISSNLSQPVVIKIREDGPKDVLQEQSVDARCMFWDFNLADGIGDWSEEGCTFINTVNRDTTCHCSHLSTFAVLREALYPVPSATKASFILNPWTKLSVSIVLILDGLTLLALVFSRKLCGSNSYHAIGNVCGTVFILFVVFAAGIDAVDNSTGCLMVAAMLHYFTLVALLWLAVEIRQTTQYDGGNQGSLLETFKAYTVSWGIPVLVVALTLLISFKDYTNQKYCAVSSGPALFYGTVVPIIIISLHNVATFISAFLVWRKPSFKPNHHDSLMEHGSLTKNLESWQRAQASLAVSIVFILSVILAYLHVIAPALIALKVMFSITTAAFGFMVFGMFVLHLDDIRTAVLPKSWQREYTREMSAPVSFHNMAYDGRDANDGVDNAEEVEIEASD